MTKNIDKLITDHKTMNGLISYLIDYHERLNDFLAPCLKDDSTHNDLISLVLTVEYQQDIISALHECLEQINDNDLETLQHLASVETKGGEK
ncbi:hypothetical protein DKZ23_10195 [Limosilactobacillus reuteri]|uniref:Uncharacterized protein n=1 Tax=Limosilactobacillus reuteri TaxID=1598 RepID=A0A317GET8_LIMRT|nr:hypothetical protein [Limosilactobacillus reuteri]MCH5384989.1 hypothetical protein [Limosilactobacillus reuteri]PWT44907.1 hypothetical protein DKZ23_10195 [Limosilactobacillus reuteri]PWT49607.1 hypothetical protein DKZ33_08425 [Limosilactobacillus reuteri]PWT61581.1 hypothetical protein DKZ32_07615 [Limosilactobacillus reuteri]